MRLEGKRVRLVLGVLVVLSAIMVVPGRSEAQWLTVLPHGNDRLRETCLTTSQWPTGVDRAGFFGAAIQYWGALSNGEVSQCLSNIASQGMVPVIGVWSLKEHCSSAAACFAGTQGGIQRLLSLGAVNLYLEIDEPLTSDTPPGWGTPHYSYAYAVQETAEYIRLVRTTFGPLGVALAEAYPANSSSTLSNWFPDVHNAAIAAVGSGIQWAWIDHDWNSGGTPSGAAQIGQAAMNAGIGFGVYFWNASPSQSWQAGLLSQGYLYRNWNVYPQMYVVADWTPNPTTTLAEWDSGTLTRSVRDFTNVFLPLASNSHGIQSSFWLAPNQSRVSVDGRFTLLYQADGNLVLYGPSGALWSSGTSGTSPGFAVMQLDGNLVVYDSGGTARWASNTSGQPGAYCLVQSDGNLVLYRGFVPVWSSNTAFY